MSKMEWDKRTAQDKASHLRELRMPDSSPQPKRMMRVLLIKSILSRIEREEWLKLKTPRRQQKKQLSLYTQLKREYEKYVSQYPSVKDSYLAQQVQRVLSSSTHLNLD